MSNIKLSSPWVLYYREVEALFAEDPEVKISLDEVTCTLKIYVDNNPDKADALTQLFPEYKKFGNIALTIKVLPSNVQATSKMDLFRKAFRRNPAVSYIETIDGVFKANYIVFKNKVVQYYADDPGDINGMHSTLYQDIAQDIFGSEEGIYYCTALPEDEE